MRRQPQNILRVMMGAVVVSTLLSAHVYAAAFLDNGSAARSEGMGRSVTAVADDLDAYYYNPAGYAYQKNAKLNTMYAKQMDQFNVYYTGYGTRFLNGYLAMNLYMLRLDDIPQTNYNNGEFTSAGPDFEYSSKAVFLSYAAPFKNIFGETFGQFGEKASIGINVKYLNEILFNNQASGTGIDVGAMYRLSSDVRFGVMAVNLLQPVMVWDTDSGHQDTVGRKYKIGAAYTGFHKLILSTDITLLPHEAVSSYGAEYLLNEFLSLRAGYTGFSYTFGLGLHYAQVNFDYVFMKDTVTAIDDTHKFSIGYGFGSGEDVLLPEETVEKRPEPVREEPKVIPVVIDAVVPTIQEQVAPSIPPTALPVTENIPAQIKGLF